jgi:hypothetical protein
MRVAVVVAATFLAIGCAGEKNGMRASLADVDPAGDFWAIRATCEGGHFNVDFRPGERLSLTELGHASYEDIAVECGRPERVPISEEDGAPLPPDMTEPTYEPAKLACVADGTLIVQVNPIWGPHETISGSSLRVERGGQAIVAGSLKRDEPGGKDWSRASWSRAICRPA